ncbi:hypothetical protein M1466_03320 [Candidatus Dependentiae bacterium]|nr:hypothetical protein [Candidatus Dependentiae bacterium]
MNKHLLLVCAILVQSLTAQHLLIQMYNEKNADRQAELLYCIERNIRSKFFTTITIFYDGTPDDNTYQKLKLLQAIAPTMVSINCVQGRTTYRQMFAFANTNIAWGEVICLANADIFFDESILLSDTIKDQELFAVGRYETMSGTLHGPWELSSVAHSSQDLWVFRNPCAIQCFAPTTDSGKIILHDTAFPLGVWGCDGTIARIANEQEIPVSNPCLSIKIYHWHTSAVRNYKPTQTIGDKSSWLDVEPSAID